MECYSKLFRKIYIYEFALNRTNSAAVQNCNKKGKKLKTKNEENKMWNYAHNRFCFNNSGFILGFLIVAMDMQKYAMFGYMFDKYGQCVVKIKYCL